MSIYFFANPKRFPDRTAGFLILLLFVLAFYHLGPLLWSPPSPDTTTAELVFVQIDGEVKSPGVYAFPSPPGLMELLNRADGALLQVSVAGTLKKLRFPTGRKVTLRQEGEGYRFDPGEMSAFHKLTLGIPISLNHETKEGLTALRGIGPRLSEAIVRERNRRGGFRSLDELTTVRGIGRGLMKKLRPHLKL